MTTAEKNPILRRKSMELLKDLTQILQEINGFQWFAVINPTWGIKRWAEREPGPSMPHLF
jgi:hypothetical protein